MSFFFTYDRYIWLSILAILLFIALATTLIWFAWATEAMRAP